MANSARVSRRSFMGNPLVLRYRYSLLRPRQLWVYISIYVVLTAVVLLVNQAIYKDLGYAHWDKFSKAIYYQFLLFEIVMLWFWGAFNSGSVVVNEVTQKSYEFFKLLPLSAAEKALGVLVGSNLVVLLLAGINLFLILVFGMSSPVSLWAQGQVLLTIVAGTLFFNTAFLLSSIRLDVKPTQRGHNGASAVVMLFFVVPMFLHMLVAVSPVKLAGIKVPFFAFRAPLLILLSAIMVYFAGWCFTGVLRKFERERDPMFTRAGAVLFMLGFQVISAGFFGPHMSAESRALVAGYWCISLFPLLFLPLGAARRFQAYVESWSRQRKNLWAFAAQLNLTTSVMTFLVWAVASMFVFMAVELPLTLVAGRMLTLFAFFLFYILLCEVHTLYSPSNEKLKLFVGFVGILVVVLPPIFSGIFENMDIMQYSPMAYLMILFDEPSWKSSAPVVPFYLMLSVLPGWLCVRKYRWLFAGGQNGTPHAELTGDSQS